MSACRTGNLRLRYCRDHTLSTHPITTPCLHPLFIHPINTLHQLTLCCTAILLLFSSSGTGNAAPRNCSQGYYCPGISGATTPTPICAGKLCGTGGRCMPGQECPQATAYPQPCRGGHYCASSSGVVTGLCQAGYYCIQNSTTPTPIALKNNGSLGSILGDKCPAGSYCPQASVRPIACPIGTFSRYIAARNGMSWHVMSYIILYHVISHHTHCLTD